MEVVSHCQVWPLALARAVYWRLVHISSNVTILQYLYSTSIEQPYTFSPFSSPQAATRRAGGVAALAPLVGRRKSSSRSPLPPLLDDRLCGAGHWRLRATSIDGEGFHMASTDLPPGGLRPPQPGPWCNARPQDSGLPSRTGAADCGRGSCIRKSFDFLSTESTPRVPLT